MSDASSGRHRGARSALVHRHRVLRALGFGILSITVGLGLFSAYTYRHLNENLTVIDLSKQLGKDRPDKLDVEGPKEPLNVLVMGSDSRDGDGNNIDGLAGSGERSDTTLLFHLSADRKSAYGVSLPRDAMVERPTCYAEDGTEIPGGLDMWNAAFSLGGPACTIRQAEQLTGLRIDHFVVLDFNGFKGMVDAIDGVEICLPEDVNDETGNITLEAGTREVEGQEALDYVRVRYAISNNGDIGRMKRQQAFIASMAAKVTSAGVLGRPDRLFGFLDAATESLTLDENLDSVKKLADLAGEFQGIGLDKIKFLTVPFEFYEPDPNRLAWTEEADLLWERMMKDEPLGERLSSDVITAAQPPGAGGPPSTDDSAAPGEDASEEPDEGGTESPSSDPTQSPDAAQTAAENGLCA